MPGRWKRQAGAALRHADAVVSDTRRGDAADREARLLQEHALRDLVRQQEQLVRLHARIEAAAYGDRAELWQRFFLCYDDFVTALQAAPRCGVEAPRGRRASQRRSSS